MVFAAISIAIGAIRALTAELYLFRYSGTDEDARPVFGGSLVVGLILGSGAAIAGATLGALGFTGEAVAWVASAGVLLGTLLQDQTRFLLIGVQRAQHAVASEIFSLIAIVAGFLIVALVDQSTILAVLLVWLASTVPPAILGIIILGMAGPKTSLLWMRKHAAEGRVYFADFFLTNGIANGVIFIVAAVGGAAASAALRGAQVLLTPILMVTRGGAVGFAPEFKRLAARGDRRALIGLAVWFAVVTTVMVGATVIVVMLLPAEWIEFALGDSASASAAVLPACALAVGIAGVAMAPALALRARGQVKAAFRAKIYSAPLSVAGATLGSIAAGAAGSQIGLAIGEGSRAGMNWFTLLRDNEGLTR